MRVAFSRKYFLKLKNSFVKLQKLLNYFKKIRIH